MSSVSLPKGLPFMILTKLKQNRDRVDSRQNAGMTRNDSPVYFFYPPDPSGRRPSPLTELQYVNPAQRSAQQSHSAAEHSVSVSGRPDQSMQQVLCNSTYEPRHHIMDPNTRPSYENLTTRPIIGGGGNHASPESSYGGSSSRSYPQPTRTLCWFCCRQCVHPGPYTSSLYATCLGCGYPKCSQCSEVVLEVRDRGFRR